MPLIFGPQGIIAFHSTPLTPAEPNLSLIISPAPLMRATGARYFNPELSGTNCTPVVIRNLRAIQTFNHLMRDECHVCWRSEGGTSIPTVGSGVFHFHFCSRLLDRLRLPSQSSLCAHQRLWHLFSPSTTNLAGDITTYKPVYSC